MNAERSRHIAFVAGGVERLQIGIVARGVLRSAPDTWIRATLKGELERAGDGLRDFVLHRKQIFGVAVVEAVRPKMQAAARVDQLRSDADPVAHPLHAALENVVHAEVPRDRRDIFILSLVGERGGASRHAQIRHMRDRVQDLFGDAVAEVFVRRIAAHVNERQHRDRFHFR